MVSRDLTPAAHTFVCSYTSYMKCKCVKCDKAYNADATLDVELRRFYEVHKKKPPAVVPWVCESCWGTLNVGDGPPKVNPN